MYELIFKAPNYSRVYFEDKYLITGHVPTRAIHGAKPDENVFLMDCGCGFGSGKLACMCIETGERFYSEN